MNINCLSLRAGHSTKLSVLRGNPPRIIMLAGLLRAFAFAMTLTVLLSSPAFALNTQLGRQNIGPTGTFSLSGSRTVEPKRYSFGMSLNYAEDTLELHNFTTGAQVRQIVDYDAVLNLGAEFGLFKNFSAGLEVPLHTVRHMVPTNTALYDRYFNIGDVTVYGKYAVLDSKENLFGLAFQPFVTAPSGSLNHFIGDRSLGFGLRAILDKEFADNYYIGANIGYKGRAKDDTITVTGSTASLNIDDEFIYGIGGTADIIKDRLQLVAELTGSTVIEDFAKTEKTSPLEAVGGVKAFFLNKSLAAFVGGGAGINAGYGAPKFRIIGGISATLPVAKKASVVQTEKKIETIILQGVTFFFDSAELMPDSKKVLDENVAELKKYPDVRFVVNGHTDNVGTEEYNQKLSERRAEAVASYFVEKGLPKGKVESKGTGETSPLVANDSKKHQEKNRRIELMIIHN